MTPYIPQYILNIKTPSLFSPLFSVNHTHKAFIPTPTPLSCISLISNTGRTININIFENWWLGLSLFFALILLLTYIIIRNYALKRQSNSRYLKQQQFIRLERQRISSEIHDEVGAGISAIKLYAELACKKRANVEEIKQISLMVNELAVKINEVVWSTNAESDNLESLLYYIAEQTGKQFEYSDITFEASIPQDIPDLVVSSQSRRNCYLIIKEIAHNTLKHSKASQVKLKIAILEGSIIFTIKDDGIGFDPNATKINSMGLANIKLRIEKLKGSFVIENYKGTVISISIPVKDNIMPDFKPVENNWKFWAKAEK